jgi:hypothetical protein
MLEMNTLDETIKKNIQIYRVTGDHREVRPRPGAQKASGWSAAVMAAAFLRSRRFVRMT